MLRIVKCNIGWILYYNDIQLCAPITDLSVLVSLQIQIGVAVLVELNQPPCAELPDTKI